MAMKMGALGIGPKDAPEQGPPPFGGPPKGGPPPDMQGPDDAAGSTGLTPEMLEYHGGGMSCGGCLHFTDPDQCDRFPDPVEPDGYCNGFEDGGVGDEQGGGGLDDLAALAGPEGGGSIGPPHP